MHITEYTSQPIALKEGSLGDCASPRACRSCAPHFMLYALVHIVADKAFKLCQPIGCSLGEQVRKDSNPR